jgi:hypothetical protein
MSWHDGAKLIVFPRGNKALAQVIAAINFSAGLSINTRKAE